uniref:Uncharacterized protein n=1 Tax=Arundo donax TaxID=35708 RepID=A0A0A9FLC9_ARUDO
MNGTCSMILCSYLSPWCKPSLLSSSLCRDQNLLRLPSSSSAQLKQHSQRTLRPHCPWGHCR